MMKEKTLLLDEFVRFQIRITDFIILVRNYLFLKNYVTSEGVVSHNVFKQMFVKYKKLYWKKSFK